MRYIYNCLEDFILVFFKFCDTMQGAVYPYVYPTNEKYA